MYDLDERKERPFERLDGFGDVRVDLRDLDAGSVKLSSFTLTREGRDEPYGMSMRGTSTPRDLASELGTATGGTLGGLLGGLASGVLPDAGMGSVPLRMDATVSSDDGRPRVDQARATVAGVPAGRLTEVVLRAVLERLYLGHPVQPRPDQGLKFFDPPPGGPYRPAGVGAPATDRRYGWRRLQHGARKPAARRLRAVAPRRRAPEGLLRALRQRGR